MRLTFATLALLGLTYAAPVARNQTACNGNAALCTRQYSNISLVGTHDSAFVGSIDNLFINQEKTVTDQLNAGIRFLQAQTHNDNSGTLSMCHTSCDEWDAGPLATYLSTVKTWLDANPNEVLTMLLVNGDSLGVGNFSAIFESTGISKYAFVPSTSPNQLAMDDWPTLQNMITAGKRLVVFLDTGADQSSVNYIMDEFTYFFETPYDTTDPTFAECTLDRPPNGSPDGRMYIVNHFLDSKLAFTSVLYPDNSADFTTNAATGTGSIGAQANLCTSTYDRAPNLILVDMFDRGHVFAAQNTLNGLS